MSFPSELPVASTLVYPSRDKSAAGRRARDFVVYRIKQDKPATSAGDQGAIAFTIERMKMQLADSLLAEFFVGEGILVPVPRHARLHAGALWPAKRICEELLRAGIGEDVVPCLERTRTVAKSAFAKPGERPGPQEHYASISCDLSLLNPARVILVDDVVTRGATLLGSAGRICEGLPRAEVVAFAIARVDQEARLASIGEMFAPALETIRYDTQTRVFARG